MFESHSWHTIYLSLLQICNVFKEIKGKKIANHHEILAFILRFG